MRAVRGPHLCPRASHAGRIGELRLVATKGPVSQLCVCDG